MREFMHRLAVASLCGFVAFLNHMVRYELAPTQDEALARAEADIEAWEMEL